MKKKFFVHYTDEMADQDCVAEVFSYSKDDAHCDFEFSYITVHYINTEAEEQEEK